MIFNQGSSQNFMIFLNQNPKNTQKIELLKKYFDHIIDYVALQYFF